MSGIANVVVYDATKFTFHTFHWYGYRYADVPQTFPFTSKGLARETTVISLEGIL